MSLKFRDDLKLSSSRKLLKISESWQLVGINLSLGPHINPGWNPTQQVSPCSDTLCFPGSVCHRWKLSAGFGVTSSSHLILTCVTDRAQKVRPYEAESGKSSKFVKFSFYETHKNIQYYIVLCTVLDIEGLCFYEEGWRLPDTGKEQFQPWLLKVGQACWNTHSHSRWCLHLFAIHFCLHLQEWNIDLDRRSADKTALTSGAIACLFLFTFTRFIC